MPNSQNKIKCVRTKERLLRFIKNNECQICLQGAIRVRAEVPTRGRLMHR